MKKGTKKKRGTKKQKSVNMITIYLYQDKENDLNPSCKQSVIFKRTKINDIKHKTLPLIFMC